MGSDYVQEISEELVEFERALEHLVIASYGKGVPVEGSWEITVPVSDAPDWTVTIEKTYSEERTSYQPDLLEE